MGLTARKAVESITWTAAAALFAAQLYPQNTQGYTPAFAELICWALVLGFIELSPRLRARFLGEANISFTASPSYLPWVAAVSILVTTLSSSVDSFAWITPATAPILLALRRSSWLPRFRASRTESLHSIWLACGIGTASVLALVPIDKPSKLALAWLPLLGSVGLYSALVRIYEQDGEQVNTGSTSWKEVPILRAIALRAVGLLVALVIILMSVLLPGRGPNLGQAVVAGSLKATHWIAVSWLTRELSWEIAPIMWTYAAATHSPLNPNISESFQLFTHLLVAVLALYQVVDLLPKGTRGRYFLFALILWPIASTVQQSFRSEGVPFSPGQVGLQPSSLHPIEELFLKAHGNVAFLVNSQSRTLDAAEAGYRKRYARDPPPGFDKWFTYAKSRNSVIIDDFDMINDDMKPFWKISPQRLLESVDHVTKTEELALRKCGFTSGMFHGQGGGWIVDDLGRLLEEVSKDLPDVEFAFDVVDEPRVVITQQMLDAGGVAEPEFRNEAHKSTWNRVTGPCMNAVPRTYQPAVYDYNIPFVQDWYHAKDICQHPEFAQMHGFFTSPATCLLTDAPVPVLSQAAPTSFGDIMYPSPWYIAKQDQGNYKGEEDPLWEQKTNTLYWAGSTTGSHSTNGSWRHSHRQRFVDLIQSLNATSHKYLNETKPRVWKAYESVEDYQDLFDVKLTAVIQCDEEDCKAQKEHFNILGEKEEQSQQFQSRFVFDTDGNSFSGRYYTLLQSRSVVLKQTVLREWHDERLVPWAHYIPVSLSMDELPETMRYLASQDGQYVAKGIANAGREWHGKVLRREDFTIYLYRLMLELARIMDPNREVE